MADYYTNMASAIDADKVLSNLAQQGREDITAKYRRNVGDWNQARLEEANTAAVDARAARKKAIEDEARRLANEQIGRERIAAEADAKSKKLSRAKYVQQMEEFGYDGPLSADELADELDAKTDSKAAADYADKFVADSRRDDKTKSKMVGVLNEYLKNGRAQIQPGGGATSAVYGSSGQTGAVNADYLAKVFKDRIVDEQPEYMDVGEDAYISKLRESEGARASIEASLPKGTDVIDTALAAAVKRNEDRLAKVQLKSVLSKEKNITDAATRWKQYESDAALNNDKLEFEKLKLDRNIGSREKIAKGHDVTAANISAGRNETNLKITDLNTRTRILAAEKALQGDLALSPFGQSLERYAAAIAKLGLTPQEQHLLLRLAKDKYGLAPSSQGTGIEQNAEVVPGTPGFTIGGFDTGIGGAAPTVKIVNDTIANRYAPQPKKAEVKGPKAPKATKTAVIDNPAKFAEWESLVGYGVTKKNNGDGTTTFTSGTKTYTYKNSR